MVNDEKTYKEAFEEANSLVQGASIDGEVMVKISVASLTAFLELTTKVREVLKSTEMITDNGKTYVRIRKHNGKRYGTLMRSIRKHYPYRDPEEERHERKDPS